jgi:hypothetical protein
LDLRESAFLRNTIARAYADFRIHGAIRDIDSTGQNKDRVRRSRIASRIKTSCYCN